MRRRGSIALAIVGAFALGGAVVAGGLFLLSLVLPLDPLRLRIGMVLCIAGFAVMGLVASVRYLLRGRI